MNNDNDHPVMGEVWKAEHIFNALGREYRFAISEASKLPVLAMAPEDCVGVFMPSVHLKVSFPASMADDGISELESRALLPAAEVPVAEALAHVLRSRALLEASPERRAGLFERAHNLYRSILRVCPHPTPIALAEDLQMNKGLVMVSPVSDMHTVPEPIRRLIAHSLSGMALCTLMGQHKPVRCFGLVSAAVGWEPHRPLELANLLRIQVLLTGMFHLGLVQLYSDGEFAVLGMREVDALMGTPLMAIPVVYMTMTTRIVLPAVLRHGTDAMLQGEREIVPREQWEEVGVFVLICSWGGHPFISPCSHRPSASPPSSTSAPTNASPGRSPIPRASGASASSTARSTSASAAAAACGSPATASSTAAAGAAGCFTVARRARSPTGRRIRRSVSRVDSPFCTAAAAYICAP
jgi:hypothetical protein